MYVSTIRSTTEQRQKPHIRLGLKTYYSNVGATIGRPRSYRSPPRIPLLPKSVIYRSLLLREGGLTRRSAEVKTDEWTKWKVTLFQDHSSTASKVASRYAPSREGFWEITAAHPSVAQKRDLQKPSLVREHVAKRLSSFLRKRRVADKRSLRSAG